MQENSLKKGMISGFFWKALENGGDQLITFVISLVLARLLGPEKYGTMSVMLIFVTIANVIIQTGFQTALIQKKDATEDDFTSVFWVGLLLAAVLYLFIYLIAPTAAVYFEDPDISPMLRVLSLILFFGAVSSVLIAKVARGLNFRLQCIATVAADLVSGVLGVVAALNGLGTWALVMQQVFKHLLLMGILTALLHWKPCGRFSRESIRELFSYGWKVLASGLIDTVYSNLYTPVIKKLYNPEMVGLYNRANQFPQVFANAAASTLQAVLLPGLSRTQGCEEENRRLSRSIMRRSLKLSSFVMFPVMFGMMAVSDSFVRFLLGESWLGAAPLLQLCCLSYSVWHIHVTNLQAINANGRSDIYLRLEIIKKIIGVALLIFSARYGVLAMLASKAAFDYVCTFINGTPNGRIVGYGPLEQWKDILPEFFLSALMGLSVYGLQLLLGIFGIEPSATGSAFLILLVQVAAGVVLYLGLAFAFHLESLRYLFLTGKKLLHLPGAEKEGDKA